VLGNITIHLRKVKIRSVPLVIAEIAFLLLRTSGMFTSTLSLPAGTAIEKKAMDISLARSSDNVAAAQAKRRQGPVVKFQCEINKGCVC